MFTSVGHRPNTIQQLSIGASRDGQLAAIEHVSRSSIGMTGELINLVTYGTPPRTHAPMSRHARLRFARAFRHRAGCVHPGRPKARSPWSRPSTSSRHAQHRSHRVACEESRARAAGDWPAVVEQCATRLLSTGRRALRLVAALQSPGRCGRVGSSSDTASHEGHWARISPHAEPSHPSGEMELPLFAAARPISGRALIPS